MSQYPACSVHGPARKSLAPSAAWNSAVLIPVFQVLSTYVSYWSSSGILLSWYHRHSSLGVKKTPQLSVYLQIYTHVSQTCACDRMNHRCVCFAADVFVAVGTVSTRHTRQVFVSVVAISSPFWLTKPERSHSAVASCAGNVLLLAPPVRLCTLGDSLQPRNRSIILQECWLTADSRGHYTYAMHCACHSVGKPR